MLTLCDSRSRFRIFAKTFMRNRLKQCWPPLSEFSPPSAHSSAFCSTNLLISLYLSMISRSLISGEREWGWRRVLRAWQAWPQRRQVIRRQKQQRTVWLQCRKSRQKMLPSKYKERPLWKSEWKSGRCVQSRVSSEVMLSEDSPSRITLITLKKYLQLKEIGRCRFLAEKLKNTVFRKSTPLRTAVIQKALTLFSATATIGLASFSFASSLVQHSSMASGYSRTGVRFISAKRARRRRLQPGKQRHWMSLPGSWLSMQVTQYFRKQKNSCPRCLNRSRHPACPSASRVSPSSPTHAKHCSCQSNSSPKMLSSLAPPAPSSRSPNSSPLHSSISGSYDLQSSCSSSRRNSGTLKQAQAQQTSAKVLSYSEPFLLSALRASASMRQVKLRQTATNLIFSRRWAGGLPARSFCFCGSWKPMWLRLNSARLASEMRMSQQTSLITGSSRRRYSAARAPTVISTFCPRRSASSEPYRQRKPGGCDVFSSRWKIFSRWISMSALILRSWSGEQGRDQHPLSWITLSSMCSLVDCSSSSSVQIFLGSSSAKMGAVLRMPCSVWTQIWYCLKQGSLSMRKLNLPFPQSFPWCSIFSVMLMVLLSRSRCRSGSLANSLQKETQVSAKKEKVSLSFGPGCFQIRIWKQVLCSSEARTLVVRLGSRPWASLQTIVFPVSTSFTDTLCSAACSPPSCERSRTFFSRRTGAEQLWRLREVCPLKTDCAGRGAMVWIEKENSSPGWSRSSSTSAASPCTLSSITCERRRSKLILPTPPFQNSTAKS